MRAAPFPAWEGCRESGDIPRDIPRHVCGGTRDAVGRANMPRSCVPTTWQGADASRDPADFPGQTRPLFDRACSRGACREMAYPGPSSALSSISDHWHGCICWHTCSYLQSLTFRKISCKLLLQAWFRNCSIRCWMKREPVTELLQETVSGETEDAKCDFTGVPHCNSD